MTKPSAQSESEQARPRQVICIRREIGRDMIERAIVATDGIGAPYVPAVDYDHLRNENKRLREACDVALKEFNFILSDPDKRGGLYEAARDKLRAVLKEAE